jgi:YD repeat-containing protein
MRILITLAAILALQACKHPLAIVGEGDIIDVSNSGHGCSLEQFQARDIACTGNEVTGDYVVNYKAEPRPGWRFVRWDGPCSQQSDFQYCRIESDEDWVVWMDDNYPDYELPPSTALFEPIPDGIGFLVGPPVAGVAYVTPTHESVTGPGGRFHYEEGESVRFMLGDTLLGEVIGQAQVTPFDLAGSAVVTGINITWALEDEDDLFHAVTNIAVFLQSLDYDADPENGIEIRPDVAALFQGVSLEMSQHWRAIQTEPRLRHALAQANSEQRFSEAHGIVKPAVALEHLYAALEISPRTVGVTVLKNEDEAGNSEFVENWQYDANGNVTLHYGALGFESWQYDANGNMTRFERRASASIFSIYDEIETRHYDANGNVTRQAIDGDANGVPERVINYQYNEDGNPTRVQVDDHLDSTPTGGFEYWQYDDNGSLTQLIESWYEADGIEGFQSWQYDAYGNETRYEQYTEQIFSRVRHRIESWQYDTNGNVTRAEIDSDANGSPDSIERRQYDADGKLTRYENDDDANGMPDEIETWHYQYDENGNLTHKERFDAVDGTLEELETWQYDADSNVTRYENMTLFECYGVCEGVPPDHRLELWQYHANGTVMLHEVTTTGHFWDLGNLYETGGVQRYHYDASGNLTRFDGGELGDATISTWQYDENNNLTRDEQGGGDDGRPDQIETWQYDFDGNLTRYDWDENGDGTTEEATTYQYEATGWGHFFSDAEMWGHRSPPPLKPRPDPVFSW